MKYAVGAAAADALLRVCHDVAASDETADAFPTLVAVASSALLGADESYVTDAELARAWARLQPALAAEEHAATLAEVRAALEACCTRFHACQDNVRRTALLRAATQQRAVDSFVEGRHPVVVPPKLQTETAVKVGPAQADRRRNKKARKASSYDGLQRSRGSLLGRVGLACGVLLVVSCIAFLASDGRRRRRLLRKFWRALRGRQ